MTLRRILELLHCPDCAGKLVLSLQKVQCNDCGRKFFHNGKFIDLLPSKPKELFDAFSQRAVKYYYSQFSILPNQTFKKPTAWGSLDSAAESYKVFTRAEFDFFKKNFPISRDVFCDISAASGVHSFAAARFFKTVLHCDINLEYLQFARKKAKVEKQTNIWFLRTDYLQLPFAKNKLDMAIATDSLIYYGPQFDKQVIQQVRSSLQTKGVFCFDLHAYKWYYPDQYIFEYRLETLPLLSQSRKNINWHCFGRVPVMLTPTKFLFFTTQYLHFLPPVRYIGVLNK